MKTTPILLLSLSLAVLASGCVTATTIEAAKEHVNYKPQKVEENGRIPPPEVESVDQAKPGYYALVPFAAAADVALMPVYVLGTIAINLGILPVP
jgi:hypothetical protein